MSALCLFLHQKREVNTVLADAIKHMTPDRAFEDSYPQVTSSRVSPQCQCAMKWSRCMFFWVVKPDPNYVIIMLWAIGSVLSFCHPSLFCPVRWESKELRGFSKK